MSTTKSDDEIKEQHGANVSKDEDTVPGALHSSATNPPKVYSESQDDDDDDKLLEQRRRIVSQNVRCDEKSSFIGEKTPRETDLSSFYELNIK